MLARNLFAAALFWGQQTLWCLTKSTAHFLIFMDRVYIYIFYLIFHAANKRIFLWHGNSELLDILALVST